MTQIEAMKLALEALEDENSLSKMKTARAILREALAKQEQSVSVGEPVAWKPDRSGKYLTIVYRDVDIVDEVHALTGHEKSCAMSWSHALMDVNYLKRITTPQQNLRGSLEHGESVAKVGHLPETLTNKLGLPLSTPLYTTPYVPEGRQQRPVIKPLTRDDLWKLWCNAKTESEYFFWLEFARAIEAAHGIKE